MATAQMKVTGMMCEACVSHVTKALLNVEGVRQATVHLQYGSAVVQHENANPQALTEAVSEAGYEAQII